MYPKIQITKANLASIQDKGRYRGGYYGFSNSGALDQFSYQMGNAILANPLGEPSIEITASDFSLISTIDVSICITGSPAVVQIEEDVVPQWETVNLQAGKELCVSAINKGIRVYIAIAGGLKVKYVHGSASYDQGLAIGTALNKGDSIELKETKKLIRAENVLPSVHVPKYRKYWTVNICEGPDSHIFQEHISFFQLVDFRVALDSNHIGVRLENFKLKDFYPTQTLSRGIVPGAIEITPSGQPIILNRGRGGTIGYPVIGCVATTDLNMVGQFKPHDKVRFTFINTEKANQKYFAERKLIESIQSQSEELNGTFREDKK